MVSLFYWSTFTACNAKMKWKNDSVWLIHKCISLWLKEFWKKNDRSNYFFCFIFERFVTKSLLDSSFNYVTLIRFEWVFYICKKMSPAQKNDYNLFKLEECNSVEKIQMSKTSKTSEMCSSVQNSIKVAVFFTWNT